MSSSKDFKMRAGKPCRNPQQMGSSFHFDSEMGLDVMPLFIQLHPKGVDYSISVNPWDSEAAVPDVVHRARIANVRVTSVSLLSSASTRSDTVAFLEADTVCAPDGAVRTWTLCAVTPGSPTALMNLRLVGDEFLKLRCRGDASIAVHGEVVILNIGTDDRSFLLESDGISPDDREMLGFGRHYPAGETDRRGDPSAQNIREHIMWDVREHLMNILGEHPGGNVLW